MPHTKAAFRQVKPLVVSVVDGVTITDGDFNVLHYANAAACIQAAFDSIKTLGGTVRIRAGSYAISTAISTAGQTQAVVIEGEGGTILTQTGANYIFDIKSSGLTLQDMSLVAGNFATDVIFGQSAIGFLGYLFFNRLVIQDIALNALQRRLIYIAEHGSDQLSAIEIKDNILYFNNTWNNDLAGVIVIDGCANNCSVHDNFITGTCRRAIVFKSPSVVNRLGGEDIRVYGNTLKLGSDTDTGFIEGITLYGWREFIRIHDNYVWIRNTGANPANGIVLGNGNMSNNYQYYGTIYGNTFYQNTPHIDSVSLLISGPGLNYARFLSITGNNAYMEGVANNQVVSLAHLDSISFESNTCLGNTILGSIKITNIINATIGVNCFDKQQTDFADQATSFNVQEQISKLWGHLTCGGAGAVTIDRDYNIASASYAGTLLTINFDRAFNAIDNYALHVTYHGPVFSAAHPVARTLSTGSCVIQKFLPSLGGGSFTSNNWAAGEKVSVSGNGTSAN